MAYQKEPSYEFSKNLTFVPKFTRYGLFSTVHAFYILILVSKHSQLWQVLPAEGAKIQLKCTVKHV